jgi:hypothetical protein
VDVELADDPGFQHIGQLTGVGRGTRQVGEPAVLVVLVGDDERPLAHRCYPPVALMK